MLKIRSILGLSLMPSSFHLGFQKPLILRSVGFDLKHCKEAISAGQHFRLGVFPASSSGAIPATWDGLLTMVDRLTPTVSEKVRAHLAELRSVPFSEIQQLAGFDFTQVKDNRDSDDRYIDLTRLEAKSGTLVEVRAFLWNEFNITEFFSGDGFSRTPSGECGVPEFIAPNVDVDSIDKFTWIPLDISPQDFEDGS